jgi:hypothetical protein
MHLLAGAATTALVTLISLGADAADLNPPAPFGQPQYGMAPPPPVAPPQVIIVPGPGAPQYPSAAFPPPPIAPPPPWGVAPPIYPRADVPPRAVCPPTWRCGGYGCGWQPNCAPPERYSGQYAPPGPIYAQPGPAGPPGPPVYSEPTPAPAPYSDPYAPRSYPGPTGPY